MSALRKPTEQLEVESRRILSLPSKRRRRYSYGAIVVETLLKVLVNGVLSAAAIAALSDLLPHLQSNRAKLQEIQVRVEEAEVKVEQLRDKFSKTFDPSQAKSVMQQQSARMDPDRRRVVFNKSSRKTAGKKALLEGSE
ncbi:MAG: hypothetical protein SW833_24635 [Cyanobacteriota bacterium]|nr:hypothetical protein [Cyanobacteriota bacterium]